MKKTPEEVEALKKNWLRDACWDIETTEGFEEHTAELLKFREECEKQWQEEAKEKKDKRYKAFKSETGIDDFELAQYLFTFRQIQEDANKRISSFDDDISDAKTARTGIASAQLDATLLLAAQVKRVADILERFYVNGLHS